jgi:phosphoribosyl 1,2-cyclic phosphate phosphodiesterase
MPVRDLEFLFLGTGTSAGVPIIACDCDVCRSTDPRDKRTRCGACLRFTDPRGLERVVLIDATPDLREQAIRHRLRRCDAIVFTHNHVDHTFGLDEVRRFNAVMQAPIDIHADGHTLETLTRTFTHIFERHKNVNDSFVATLVPHLIDADRPLDLHGLRFTPLRLVHGRLPVLGFRIDEINAPSDGDGRVGESILPLAYCTDVSSIPPETWPHLIGLSTLVLDMLRYRHHPTHLTVDQAVEIASRVGARRTWFTHMTHDIRHAALDDELPESMSLAYDGLTLRAGFAGLPGGAGAPSREAPAPRGESSK